MLIDATIQPPAFSANKTFTFVITRGPGGAGGLDRIIVNPETHGEPGTYPGGHARINKRGTGTRKLVWIASQSFQIEFTEMSSSAEIGHGNSSDLFSNTDGPTESGGVFRFEGQLRGGSGVEAVIYKYVIKGMEGCENLDPLIVVDR